MARIGVIKPSVSRYALTEGDWVEFKDRLTVGERKRLEGSGVVGVQQRTAGADPRARQSFELDFERLGLARFEAYITAWSLLGLDEKALPVNPDTIGTLDPVIADEIDKALDAHVEKMTKQGNASAPVPVSVTS